MFKGLENLSQLGSLFKQAQEMGGKMQQLNESLRASQVTGVGAGGLVEVDANGLAEVVSVRIDLTLLARQDKEMLEDCLLAAIQDAQQRARELNAAELGKLTGGIPLPGLEEALKKFTGP